jgi:DNA-binding Lrp family transcriptional regulator
VRQQSSASADNRRRLPTTEPQLAAGIASYPVEGQPPRLDDTDLALIRLLQRDARQTNKDLAEAVGIAQSTCLERIRALRAVGVIKGWHADIDLDAIGRPLRAMISVRLRPKTTTSVRAFQQEMVEAPEVLAVWTVTGADDFLVEVATHDVAHLRDFVLDHVTGRSEVVDARTSLVYDQVRAWEIPPAEQLTIAGSAPDARPAPPGTKPRSSP